MRILTPRATLFVAILFSLTFLSALAQQSGEKPRPSPPAEAKVQLGKGTITVKYGAPSVRSRKIMGELVAYGKVWRTGANEATSFVTTTDLQIGDKSVPAGNYTLYTLPAADTWKLIINKQTGQWGTVYNEDQDLVRVDMMKKTLSSPQEKMSISFENTSGNSTELHVRWETTDAYVKLTAK
jgi:hypothetical protein